MQMAHKMRTYSVGLTMHAHCTHFAHMLISVQQAFCTHAKCGYNYMQNTCNIMCYVKNVRTRVQDSCKGKERKGRR
jgi:hypothetical protein